MKFEEYLAELEQDADYQEAERELRPYLDLANRVLALRLERGWSQAELARRVGTRQANISRIENAQANPTLKVLHKLAQAFEVELSIGLGPEREEVQAALGQQPPVPKVRYTVELAASGYWQFGAPPPWRELKPSGRRWLADLDEVTPIAVSTHCEDQKHIAA